MSRPVLYDYYRSSASYRVRIALNLKGVDYERRPVDLLHGEQRADDYRALNPQGLVPMLEVDGHRLTQSLAIMVYLDQVFPDPPLMPRDPVDGAHVRAMAMTIACDIHPLQNLRVNKYLEGPLGLPQQRRIAWDAHWISEGLSALETVATAGAGKFLFGDEATIADICLVPQLYNARRYKVPLGDYPTLLRTEQNANALEAFAAAHPDRQQVSA